MGTKRIQVLAVAFQAFAVLGILAFGAYAVARARPRVQGHAYWPISNPSGGSHSSCRRPLLGTPVQSPIPRI